jgi:filamentous hemagglutinin
LFAKLAAPALAGEAISACIANPAGCTATVNSLADGLLADGVVGVAGLPVGKTLLEKTLAKAASGANSALTSKAEAQLIDEIGQFSSRTQASKTATMVGAYDPATGMTAVGKSTANISAETLDPRTVSYIESKLNVKIGEFTSFCSNKAGACAEVSAADQLIRKGADPASIKFTVAVRPREVLDAGGKIIPSSIKAACPNCKAIWPN